MNLTLLFCYSCCCPACTFESPPLYFFSTFLIPVPPFLVSYSSPLTFKFKFIYLRNGTTHINEHFKKYVNMKETVAIRLISISRCTHPLSSFSLLMLCFSCWSFSSMSLLFWARDTVSFCRSCKSLWRHTLTYIINQSTTINHTNDLLRRIGQPGSHQYVQFICCTGRSLLPWLINTLIN